jgi:hypothetical protein
MDQSDAKALAGDVFKELLDRQDSCIPLPGKGRNWEYPFVLNATASLLSLRIKLGPRAKPGLLYAFLLASRADMDARRKLHDLDPTVLFEQLCADILLDFWGGRTTLSGSLVFGTARTRTETNKRCQHQPSMLDAQGG